MERLSVPQGEFDLARYPIRKHETLRAWDAADEFLLHHLAGTTDHPADVDTDVATDAEAGNADRDAGSRVDLSGTVLIVNDASGALATALADHSPVSFGDSYISELALAANLERNGIAPEQVRVLHSLEPLPDHIDVVVLKVPKSLALLEDQLIRIAPHVDDTTVIVAGAMSKHVHTSTLEVFDRVLGSTRTSRARKKARLIFVERDESLPPATSRWPTTYRLEPGRLVVHNHAGVFSAERLDVGTSFFLDALPDQAGQIRIVDLGCGNGVVGLVLAMDNPDAEVTFIDESYLAVESARNTVEQNLGANREVEFVVGDGLRQLKDHLPIERGSVDLVFNNPPFHDDHALSDATAWQMFTESHAALRQGGQLWVVGNRHLAYHAKLKRIFGNCDIIASNSKFVVFRATRR